jgi:hypothetical protein
MIEFLRPDIWWPAPYSIEQAFGVMQAAIALASTSEGDNKKGIAAGDRLFGTDASGIDPLVEINSIKDLRNAFHRLSLGRGCPSAEDWRQAHGLGPTGTLACSFPHFAPFKGTPLKERTRASEADIKNALKGLLEGHIGQELAVSPNCIHLNARKIERVSITLYPQGYVFSLKYGLEGSAWSLKLAQGGTQTPFTKTLNQALRRIALLVGDHPSAATAGSLAAALNADQDTADPPSPDWWLDDCWIADGERPVAVSFRGSKRKLPRYEAFFDGRGFDKGTILAHFPSGQVLHRSCNDDYEHFACAVSALEEEWPACKGTPAEDIVEKILRQTSRTKKPDSARAP